MATASPPLAPAFPNRGYSLGPSQPPPSICSRASACLRARAALRPSRPRTPPGGGRGAVSCKATEVSLADNEPSPSSSPPSSSSDNWVPVVPLTALPRGERRVIIQDGETILLLWYQNQVFAIENRSPAEGAYSEGLLNAKLTQDGCIVCPTTDSTFDLRSGAIKDWYPKNPVLRVLTPALRTLFVYPVKTDEENIFINMKGTARSDVSAEIVFSGKAQPGVTATDVNVDEVRMVVDEEFVGFGFTGKNELINGKAAVIGFLLLLDFELLTGKGLLKGTGFLDFLYAASNAFKGKCVCDGYMMLRGPFQIITWRALTPPLAMIEKRIPKGTPGCGGGSGASGCRRSGSPARRSGSGSAPTPPPEGAAVAHDIASYCLRGPSCLDKLNFPSLLPPTARPGMSPRSVQRAASDAGMAVDAQFIARRSSEEADGASTAHHPGARGGGMHAGWECAHGNEASSGTWGGRRADDGLSISVDDYL
ncbi:hypothetical protein NL676_028136 [Syzygium grande]|nr:hypothetical protein NL676_028136 [Syzygium grande]